MKENDAPKELYTFYGLEDITLEKVNYQNEQLKNKQEELLLGITCTNQATKEGCKC
jgi:hypothetical protein